MNITVTPSAIIVQTNEDGFTRDNVEAICATGKSSKKASAEDSHIGEKGFGFKSVFSIADKVHIQSGVWSFRFEHQQGEDGLGMVTPLENPTDAAAQTGTRITLSLSETTRQEYERLLDALDDLPDTIIFYLQKLRKIEINMVRPDGSSEAREIHKRVDLFDHKVTLTRTTRRDDQGPEHDNIDESVYHVFSHTISQMPQDVRRRGRTSAKVELAFPVRTDDGQPKLCDRGQYVFAYLPLQRLSQIQVSLAVYEVEKSDKANSSLFNPILLHLQVVRTLSTVPGTTKFVMVSPRCSQLPLRLSLLVIIP